MKFSEALNGDFSKWVIGLLSVIVIAFAGWIVTNQSSLEAKINIIAIAQSKIEERFSQIDELVRITRTEQVSRTDRFAEVSVKLSNLLTRQDIIDSRTNNIYERVFHINSRIDNLLSQKKKENKDQ